MPGKNRYFDCIVRKIMKIVNCAICGSWNFKLIYRTKDLYLDLPGEFSIVRCNNCGFVYLNPQISGDEFAVYYPNYYYTRANRGNVTEPEERRLNKVYSKRSNLIREYRINGDLLDVGSGDGLFLNYMKLENWNGRLAGLEPSKKAVEFSERKLGLEIFQGDLTSVSLKEKQFDIITMWEVLEHLPDVNKNLAKARDILKDNGVLAASVPNYGSLQRLIFGKYWKAIDSPRHFYQFTAKDIQSVLVKNGFGKVMIRSTSAFKFNMDGYSESIRFILKDKGMYPRNVHSQPDVSSNVSKRVFLRSFLATGLHTAEFCLFSPIEAVGFMLNMGETLLIVAEKR